MITNLKILKEKRERLRGIRPLTKEEVKVKAQIETIQQVLGTINEWEKVKCIDKKEKCHECVDELRRMLDGTSEGKDK